jgi:PTS system nitrogen regulatory IIA component
LNFSLKQAAEVFGVSENTIIEWINSENLPAELVANQYRFHRADLLEWAALQKKDFSPTIFSKVNGELSPAATHLADALEVGGVIRNVAGSNLCDVLRNALEGLPIPDSFGTETLLELFLAREHVGSTAFGQGIAIPHPRHPVLLTVSRPVVRLCFLSRPLDMSTRDGTPVDKLFLIICPTAHDHLQLLARLSAVLRVEPVMKALQAQTDTGRLLHLIREAGQRFDDKLAATRSTSTTSTT